MRVQTLLSPIHDPDERLLEPLRNSLADLLLLYEHLVFGISQKTSANVSACLRSFPNVTVVQSNGYSSGARNAFVEALKFNELYHWVDSDRILHWLSAYPDEFKRLLESPPEKHYTILGRTRRAQLTHPESWTYCEKPCNDLASRRFGIEVDICVANLFLSKDAIQLIVQHFTSQGWGILTEWPLIISRYAGKGSLGYIEIEGNEWEDPDYYKEEIAQAGGLDLWKIQRYGSESQWLKRLHNSIEIITPLLQYSTVVEIDGQVGHPDLVGDRETLERVKRKAK